MTPANRAVAQQSVLSTRWLAWILIGGAFALPIALAAVVGEDIASVAGYAFGRIGAALAVGMLIVAAVTIKAVPLTKARGEMVLGMLLLGWAASGAYAEWRNITEAKSAAQQMLALMKNANSEGPIAQVSMPLAAPVSASNVLAPSSIAAYTGGLIEMSAKTARDLAALRSQKANIDLAPILAASTLTNPELIGAARERIAAYRKLVQAEGDRSTAYFEEAGKYLRTAPAAEEFRRSTLEGFNKTAATSRPVYQEYTATELRVLDDVSSILDFSAAHQRKMGLQGDQLMFAAEADLAEYRRLFGKFRDSTAAESVVTAKLATLRKDGAQRQANLEKLLKQVP